MTQVGKCVENASPMAVGDIKSKKKKKKHRNQAVTQEVSFSEHNQSGETHSSFSFNFCTTLENGEVVATPKKEITARINVDSLKQEKEIMENGIDDTEGFNASVHGDELSGGSHKKKKKKKKQLDEDGTDDAQSSCILDDSLLAEGCITNMVEDTENGEATPKERKKKKKRKRASLDEGVEEDQHNLLHEANMDEERLVPNATDENLISPSSKKKKKKKKEDEKESSSIIEENGCSEEEEEADKKSSVNDSIVTPGKQLKQVSFSIENQAGDFGGIQEVEGVEDKPQEDVDELKEALNTGDDEPADPESFTMISAIRQPKKSKVDRVLPDWLSNPTNVSTDLLFGVPISSIVGIDRQLLQRLKHEKVEQFFPIQAAVIPELLANSKSISMRYRPRDICVSAPTGSGKTLAYVLPIVQSLRNRVVPRLRAVVLLPTQELAVQVHSVFETYVKFTKLKVCLAVGSHNIESEENLLVMEDSIEGTGADILVATPGRISDHISYTKGLTFKYLRFFVVDEADIFTSSSGGNFLLVIEQLKKQIFRPTPDNSVICGGFQARDAICLPDYHIQQILVSATLMHDPEQLKVFDLHRPKLFIGSKNVAAPEVSGTIVPYMRPEELTEEYAIVDVDLKPLILFHFIKTNKSRRFLIFTKSKMATKMLWIVLSNMSSKYNIAKFSAQEKKRKEILSAFAAGKIKILISSDAMARGLDINCIDQVVSYDVPSVQTYVHRIGRAGRAGKKGFALTLVEDTVESKKEFKSILTSCKDRLTKVTINKKTLAPYGQQYKAALETLKTRMMNEKKDLKMKKIKAKIRWIKRSKEKKKLLDGGLKPECKNEVKEGLLESEVKEKVKEKKKKKKKLLDDGLKPDDDNGVTEDVPESEAEKKVKEKKKRKKSKT